MKHFVLACSVAFSSLAIACGGSNPSEAQHPGHGHGHGHGKGHGEHAGKEHGHGHDEKPGHGHGKMKPELHAFHEVLAPAWHSPAGAERVAKTCGQAATLEEKAAATKDQELVDGTKAVTKACSDTKRDGVEPALSKVHDRFHALVER